MELFDVTKYQLPSEDTVQWEKTKEKLGIFLSEYKSSREKMGIPTNPKIQQQYSFLHKENVSKELFDDPSYQEFLFLHKIFLTGYLAIIHPYKPEITERRRKIFLLRYLYGLSVSLVSERIHYQKNIILSDSKQALIQFTSALHLIVLKQINGQKVDDSCGD
ncbi:transcriptional regulator [Enterococcus hirae]|uniref:transcriptional regulator n=1 Tax=Enterococcus sp. AZ152 TaxID=2774848 RepID=UPI00362BF5B9